MSTRLAPLLAAVGLAFSLTDASAQCVTSPAMRRLATPNFAASLNPGGSLFRADTLGLRPTGLTESLLDGASVWVTGNVGTQLRVTAPTLQGQGFEVQPGPLNAQGQPLTDCTPFNRVWMVRRADIEAYDTSGALTNDLRDWPVAAGAPVVDGDGVAGNYNLAGGDRPRLIGDVTAWWVMNDQTLARESGGVPVGIELRTMAYAYDAGSLKDILFVRYTLIYRPADGQPLTNARLGMWASPGRLGDPKPGADSSLSISYAFNTNFYPTYTSGNAIDASAGVQLLPQAAESANLEPAGYIGHYQYNFYNQSATSEPTSPEHYQQYMSGMWKDGLPWREYDYGYSPSSVYPTVRFIFPAFPRTFWSAEVDGTPSTAFRPVKGVFIANTPFVWQPGQTRILTATFPLVQRRPSGTHPVTTLRILAALAKQATQQLAVASEDVPSARPSTLAFSLGPNPTRGALRGTLPPGAQATVSLFDLLGRELRTLATLENGGPFTADVSDVPPGVYLVRVRAGERTTWQRLIVAR